MTAGRLDRSKKVLVGLVHDVGRSRAGFNQPAQSDVDPIWRYASALSGQTRRAPRLLRAKCARWRPQLSQAGTAQLDSMACPEGRCDERKDEIASSALRYTGADAVRLLRGIRMPRDPVS